METSLIKAIERIAKQKVNLVYSSIAETLLNNIHNLENFNINDYSKMASCSPASFLNFAKHLGYSGTKNLIPAIMMERNLLKVQKSAVESDNSNKNLDKSIRLENYFKFMQESLEFTNQVNRENILNFDQYLKKDQKIYLVGKGANLDVINIFANYLSKLDYHVVHSLDFEVQQKWIKNFSANDIIIIFSFTGGSTRISKIVKHAIEKNAKVINFTSNLLSYIASVATLNLSVPKNEEIMEEQRTARLSLLFIVMQIVYVLKDR
ncbi:MurR/RpiR family transcriptional regulator [Mycoplasma iguanae]|uniref:MurR/RpiR family transcriptional regulator n=1 Tax=Mycoplasma iguanae TaxID=292461 RepID=A0ABY5R863_9MOLU|nr:MurR/RpiR family transcriptional regulator [Mycoplasma iguanae]UVD81644.1 MurR/RpiR family transcriptional regulator [Mycoplasma iguanae]